MGYASGLFHECGLAELDVRISIISLVVEIFRELGQDLSEAFTVGRISFLKTEDVGGRRFLEDKRGEFSLASSMPDIQKNDFHHALV